LAPHRRRVRRRCSTSFFPLDVAATEAQLNGDLAVPPWPSESKTDLAAGESLGRSTGAAVVTQAMADNYLTVAPPATPVGPDKWMSAPSVGVVRSLHGTRPFFLASVGQLRAPAPPAVGSAAFVTGLTEVRRIADTRTPAQAAIANFWNTSSGTFTRGCAESHRGQRDPSASRVGGGSGPHPRLRQCRGVRRADRVLGLEVHLLVHPPIADGSGHRHVDRVAQSSVISSGHSCMSASFLGVVADAFPQDRERLDAIVEEAGMSRVYGGIHYRFDIEAGRDIGRAAAALALKGSLK
jgi:hypothetical protein